MRPHTLNDPLPDSVSADETRRCFNVTIVCGRRDGDVREWVNRICTIAPGAPDGPPFCWRAPLPTTPPPRARATRRGKRSIPPRHGGGVHSIEKIICGPERGARENHLHLQTCLQSIGYTNANQITAEFKALLGWERGSQPPGVHPSCARAGAPHAPADSTAALISRPASPETAGPPTPPTPLRLSQRVTYSAPPDRGRTGHSIKSRQVTGMDGDTIMFACGYAQKDHGLPRYEGPPAPTTWGFTAEELRVGRETYRLRGRGRLADKAVLCGGNNLFSAPLKFQHDVLAMICGNGGVLNRDHPSRPNAPRARLQQQ